MKIQIGINELFAQNLLEDNDFRSELSLVYNDSKISEVWVKNKIINNEEIIFRAQVLEMIKAHYCRINYSDSEDLTISYEGNLPVEVLFIGSKYRFGYLAKIIAVKNE